MNTVSEIYLCSVSLQRNHQIDFDSPEAQATYFSQKCNKKISNVQYQAFTNSVKIKGVLEDFVKCNYMFYLNKVNKSDGTFKLKRYYCWITSKQQIGNDVVLLGLELDVFQTWLFDFSLHACFVERMHVSDDTIGANTIPECLELGEYVVSGQYKFKEFNGSVVYILVTAEMQYNPLKVGNTFSPLAYTAYNEYQYTQLSNKIKSLDSQGKGDEVAFIFTFPKKIFLEITNKDADFEPFHISSVDFYNVQKTISCKEFSLVSFGSYKPKNNKLFCYPYNYLSVDTPSSNCIWKLEEFYGIKGMDNFTQADFTVQINGVFGQTPEFELVPKQYRGMENAYQDACTLSGWNMCAWINDTYSNWYAQNRNGLKAISDNAISSYNTNTAIAQNNYDVANKSNQIQTATSAVNSIGALLSGNFGSAISNGINTASNYYLNNLSNNNSLNNALLSNRTSYQNTIRTTLAQVQDSKAQPNHSKGDTTLSGIDMCRDSNTFIISRMCIKTEYAEIIDSYFQMFGYQVNKVCYPRFNTRENWNYIKTQGSNITGNVPREDLEALQLLFDSGLTVWHNDNMYHWEMDNPIKRK